MFIFYLRYLLTEWMDSQEKYLYKAGLKPQSSELDLTRNVTGCTDASDHLSTEPKFSNKLTNFFVLMNIYCVCASECVYVFVCVCERERERKWPSWRTCPKSV